jgi:hypothetical protein
MDRLLIIATIISLSIGTGYAETCDSFAKAFLSLEKVTRLSITVHDRGMKHLPSLH